MKTNESYDRRRWGIALLLGVGVLVNYFDRVNLTVSHDAFIKEFHIDDAVFGILLGAYSWTYALFQLPSGVLIDRLGVRRIGLISTLLWSVASFASAAANGVRTFFLTRLLLGIGEAPTFPANAKAIGLWFPEHQRSFATSFFDGAAKLASAFGVPLIGLLLLHIGWRLSFAATGLISFLYFLLFAAVYRDPTGAARHENTVADGMRGRVSLGFLLTQKKVIGLALGFGAYNYVFYLLLTWLPVYLTRALHIDLAHSFLYTGVPWLVAGFGDLVVGGWLVDWLIHRGWNADRVRRTVLVCGNAMGLGILGAAHAHTPTQALFWISFSIGGLSAAAPVGWSVPSLIAPGDSVAAVGGIMNQSNQISAILAPVITGFLVNGRQSFAGAFLVASSYLVVGTAAYVVLLGKIERIPMPRTAAMASQLPG